MSAELETLARSKRSSLGRTLTVGAALAAANLLAACGSSAGATAVSAAPAAGSSAAPAEATTARALSGAPSNRRDGGDDAELERACRQLLPSPAEHVAIVRVDEDRWEDRGANRLGVHHWKVTVLRVCKGGWRVSEKAAFMQYVDWSPTRAAAHPNGEAGKRLVLRTQEHPSGEFEISTGEVMALPDPG